VVAREKAVKDVFKAETFNGDEITLIANTDEAHAQIYVGGPAGFRQATHTVDKQIAFRLLRNASVYTTLEFMGMIGT
jgi:aromatic ring-opening dioxygenase LigB subunit